MKIEKLILKNFSSISNAINCSTIELDFSRTENKICLLIGPNGSGKTSILSMLHPFAELGNLDVRSNLPLILKDKDGYKEIHIKKNDDYYVIKHYYTPHKDSNHSVKSYIYKNDEDLNPNGNVTSFKEIVKVELGIETDYLKLIRLGNNVSSLIQLSTTERKKFMSKLLDEIGVYLDYYKSANNKLNQVKDMMEHDIDKLKKLNIVNIKDAEQEENDINIYIEDLHNKYIATSNELAVLEDRLDKVEDKENLRTNLMETASKLKKMTSILERKNQIESFESSFYIEKISKLENERIVKKSTYDSNISMIQNSLDLLNSFQEQYRVYEVQFNKDNEVDKELKRMEKALTEKRLKLREYESVLPADYDIKVSKEGVEKLLVFLKNTQIVLSHTYEFGQSVVEKTIELIKNKKNVSNYIAKHLIDIDDSDHQRGSLFMNMISSKIKEDINKKIESCDITCPARDLYFQIQNLLKDSQVTDRKNDTDFYKSMEYVNDNLTSIFTEFIEYKDIIERLPEHLRKDFIMDVIYDKISKTQIIYNEEKFNDLLSLVTEYSNYQNLLSAYNSDEEMLDKFKSVSNLGNTISQLELAKENIESISEKIATYRTDNSILNEEINEIDKTLEIYKEILETIEKYDEINSLHQKYSDDYALVRELDEEMYNKKTRLTELDLSLNEAKNRLAKISNDIYQYHLINKEMKKLGELFDVYTYIKNASSSKEGIPLRIIRKYLDNVEDITNELLDIAYEGKKYIDKFDISATEFSIPCYINGVRLPDVKYASQGELSFLEIALNFALSSQALRYYNIMLLDEVDGALDNSKREKFLKVVENQTERINADQVFTITHNTFFTSYPVDIIDLSFSHDKELYPLASYIDIIVDGEIK